MNAIIPLLFSLILINHKKLKNNKCYRYAVLSIVGITFFFLLNYIDYYFSIFAHSNLFHNIIGGSVIAMTVLLCLSTPIVKVGPIGAGVFMVLFALSVLLTFGLDAKVKNFISEKGGYYNQRALESPVHYTGKTQTYLSGEGGYTIQLQDGWKKRRHKDGPDYFVLNKLGVMVAELRPRCFHSTNNVMTDVVKNLEKSAYIENRLSKHQCYKKDAFFICLVKSADKDFERWHWLAMNPDSQQNIELDMLIYKPSDDVREEINFILNSVEIGPLPDPAPACTNILDWF